MALVNKCCFFIPLRDTAFILGYLKLFFGVLMFVVSFEYFPIFYDWRVRDLTSLFSRMNAIYYAATAILLIVGGHKKKSLPILSYYWISIAYSVVEFIAIFAATTMTRSPQALAFLICFALEIYFIVVIRSVYMEMESEQEKVTRGDNIEIQPITLAPKAIYPTVPTSPPGHLLYNV